MSSLVRVALLACATACGPSLIVRLPAPSYVGPPPLMEVEVRGTSATDPVVTRGSRVAFDGLEPALERSIQDATRPWTLAHVAERPSGWHLLVEITRVDAKRRGLRTSVLVGLRATLRTRDGNVYLAQTQSHCEEAAIVDPAHAAPVFDRCMASVGHELAGWLVAQRP